MRQMFYQANAFNRNLSSWDTSSLTDMYRIFYEEAFPEHRNVMYNVLDLYLNPNEHRPNVFKIAIDSL